MPQMIDILAKAPDFELTDTQGQLLKLSELSQEKYVVLVLLRGFV
jgi:peroxiredoxin